MASGLGAAIQQAHPDAEVEKIPGGKGDFIVKADGRELWNKRAMGDAFPEHREILKVLPV